MTIKTKLCGFSNLETLNFAINHPNSPALIGFIVNWRKSKRFVDTDKLKNLLNVDKKKSQFTAVLVKPDSRDLEKIKELPFDYYQIYDCDPDEIKSIKSKYNKKIISAITIKHNEDINKYREYTAVSDIILWDSAGYHKSLSWDYNLLNNIPNNFKKMIAGNIQFDDDIDKFKKICNYIDISGGIESSGVKDISKIDIFLNKVKKVNDKN